MKRLMTMLLLGGAMALQADEARFLFRRLEGATTRFPYEIADGNGKVTTVILTEDSDPASLAILKALIRQRGVWGTFAPEKDPRGITSAQGIVLTGSFTSEPMMPASIPNGAADGPYRDFKVSGIQVEFPFVRWVETDKEDPVDTPVVAEFHFELRSLIPSGVSVNGVPVDLRKYESKSKSAQGGSASRLKPGG